MKSVIETTGQLPLLPLRVHISVSTTPRTACPTCIGFWLTRARVFRTLLWHVLALLFPPDGEAVVMNLLARRFSVTCFGGILDNWPQIWICFFFRETFSTSVDLHDKVSHIFQEFSAVQVFLLVIAAASTIITASPTIPCWGLVPRVTLGGIKACVKWNVFDVSEKILAVAAASRSVVVVVLVVNQKQHTPPNYRESAFFENEGFEVAGYDKCGKCVNYVVGSKLEEGSAWLWVWRNFRVYYFALEWGGFKDFWEWNGTFLHVNLMNFSVGDIWLLHCCKALLNVYSHFCTLVA